MLRAGQIDDAIDELSRGLELAARGSGPTIPHTARSRSVAH